jgi:hypothetical protein
VKKAVVVVVVTRGSVVQGVYDVYLHSLIPAERHKGFRALLLFWDPDAGEALEITLWQDEDARRASQEEGGP